jgi:hypothetical protein
MPRTLVSNWKRWASFVVLLPITLSALDYLYGTHSDAMLFARVTLQGSIALRQRVGAVHSVDLDWLWGFREKSGFGGAKATLHLSATGSRGKEHIVMDLQEIDGSWHLIHASRPI